MCCRLYNKGEKMKEDKLLKLAEETFDYSDKKAFELLGMLLKDGNNSITTQAIFMTGAAMIASVNSMNKPLFLDGCSKLYDAYEGFGEEMGKIGKKIRES
jgi:hypothetical protein